ncbi:MAG: DUF6268 family outer membrane beta-barrel protein [Salibacteraceae bacterium]
MLKYFISISFLFSMLSCFSQDYVDLFKFTYLNSPFNKADSVPGPSRVQEFYLDVTLPIKLSERTAVITGLTIEQMSVSSNPAGFNVKAVYSTGLKLGINKKFGKKWDGTFMFLPKIAADFNRVEDNALQLGGLALFKYHKSDNLKYRVGLYYNTELFGPFFVPLLGFYYQSKNKKLEINATLPVWIDANYKFNNKLAAGVNFSAFVRSYYLSDIATNGTGQYLVKASNELYGYLQYTVNESFLFQAKVGYSIGRRFSAYDEKDRVTWGFSAFRFGDNRTETSSGIEDGVIFQGRFIYRFNLKKEEKSEQLGLK